MLLGGETHTHDYLFWEMEGQTAVRKGDFKLVLNGQLVEGETPRAKVFLSNLRDDPGETTNLADALPDLTMELTEKAMQWRQGIEQTWESRFAKNYTMA